MPGRRGRVAALLEIAGVENFNYEPEQISQVRLMGVVDKSVKKETQPRILVHPNPSTGIFTFQLINIPTETEKVVVAIFNSLGNRVTQIIIKSNSELHEIKMDLSDLPTGLYLGSVNYGNETITTKISILNE